MPRAQVVAADTINDAKDATRTRYSVDMLSPVVGFLCLKFAVVIFDET